MKKVRKNGLSGATAIVTPLIFLMSLATRRFTNTDFCLVGEGGFGPPKSLTTDLQSAPFGRSGTLPYSIRRRKVELVDGFEPPTC